MKRVIVIGSGIAGLTAALAASATHAVTLVTKGALGMSNTRFAQGGIAGVMFDDDSVEAHIADTLTAGAGLCDEEAVATGFRRPLTSHSTGKSVRWPSRWITATP